MTGWISKLTRSLQAAAGVLLDDHGAHARIVGWSADGCQEAANRKRVCACGSLLKAMTFVAATRKTAAS